MAPDHQHRIQPVRDSETLPTQHRTEIAPEVQRETRADINPAHESKLHQQHNAVKSSRTEGPTEVTQGQSESTVNERECLNPGLEADHRCISISTPVPLGSDNPSSRFFRRPPPRPRARYPCHP